MMSDLIDSRDSCTISAVVSQTGGAVDASGALMDARLPAPQTPCGRDLLVDVRAISVNPVDVKIRASDNPSGRDRVLGWDAAGVVLAVGDQVTGFAPGDEVFYAGSIDRPGTYASQHLVDERIVGRKPRSLDFAEAAALPLTSLTAWETLFDKLRAGHEPWAETDEAQPGESQSSGTLLVLGAAGGVGSMLIQLAKQLTGLTVIATASRPESKAWVEKLGADVVVDHSRTDLAEQILAVAPGGVDAVFTGQSRGRIPLFTAVVRPFGQIVAVDDEQDLDLYALKDKAITWHWEFMFARARHGWNPEAQHRALQRIAELVDEGRIRTTLTQRFTPIDAESIRAAHREIETGRTIGKIVIARV